MTNSLGVKIALGVSLALNLAVAGFFAGTSYSAFRVGEERKQLAAAGPTVWALSQRLSQQDRDGLQALLRAQGESLAVTLHDVREARREAIAKMSGSRYDAVAVGEAFARARAGEAKARAQVDEALLAFMPKLGQADRTLLAEAVVRGRIGRPAEAPPKPVPAP